MNGTKPVAFCLILSAALARGAPIASHPPMRPLPAPSAEPIGAGPARFVDASRGDDTSDGSESHPWKTLTHAVTHLEPGITLYLRGGTFYERVVVSTSGSPDRPVTIRSYPGELAVVDGGYREFSEAADLAWEPFPAGAPGVSTSTSPGKKR